MLPYLPNSYLTKQLDAIKHQLCNQIFEKQQHSSSKTGSISGVGGVLVNRGEGCCLRGSGPPLREEQQGERGCSMGGLLFNGSGGFV